MDTNHAHIYYGVVAYFREVNCLFIPPGEIKLYCKGADSVIYPRLGGGEHAQHADGTLQHLEHFASEGLRTLVFAVADIPAAVYQVPHRLTIHS